MAKRIKRITNKETVKEVVKKKTDTSKIEDLAKELREQCRERKCECPFYDEETFECRLTTGHLATPMNWDID